jgi:RNA-directed DNA polymerase
MESMVPFLGRSVSDKIRFHGTDTEKVTQAGLPVLETFRELAEFLEITESMLFWLSYDDRFSTINHYSRFSVPKRSGGTRLISAPMPHMKSAQTKIFSKIVSRLPDSEYATAFKKGASIKQNAQRHKNPAVLIRIDLKDFYGSIHFRDVREIFHGLGYNYGISTVLALLCTDRPKSSVAYRNSVYFVSTGERSLPQGAITSPALSNFAFLNHDSAIARNVEVYGWRYSRYADDLVFSHKNSAIELGVVFNTVQRFLFPTRFKVNHAKTRIAREGGRMEVTGLAIEGDRIFIPRQKMRRYRAFLHKCETQGLPAVSAEIGKSAGEVARGYLAFIYMVDRDLAAKIRRKHPWLDE